MPYQTARRLKNPDLLQLEEEDVLEALKDYTDNPALVTDYDFSPVDRLYEHYLRSRPTHGIISLNQFGAALLRVFPNLAERKPYKAQRTLNGKRITGYVGLKGPLSLRVIPQKGRRWKRTDKQINEQPPTTPNKATRPICPTYVGRSTGVEANFI